MIKEPSLQALTRILPILCVYACFTASDTGLRANPTGESVVAGNATFSLSGNVLQITTGNRTIIDWQNFSIASGEETKFIQPSASSATLNRVLGGNLSEIYGSLQSNGEIFLINPNGVVIGPNGIINTAGFVASTLDTPNAEFLKGGDLNFAGSSTAPVVNQGAINAVGGDVYLIGRQVVNSGNIAAAAGTVGLAAGTEVLLKQAGSDRIFVKPAAGRLTASGTGISNSGSIAAIQAELKASGNIYALAINNGGTIRATGAVQRGGRVLLVGNGGNINNSGRIIAKNSNGSGGTVKVDAGVGGTLITSGLVDASGAAPGTLGGEVLLLGDNVGLVDFAKVDVSGDFGGGTALIGGDLHGTNPLVRDALQVFVGSDAEIDAGAVSSGNGGKVVLWSNVATQFYGTVNAQGGLAGGNGGNVEISSKGNLAFQGNVNLAAPKGNEGSLLLDPTDITIVSGASGSGTNDGDVGDSQNNSVLFGDSATADGSLEYTISEGALEELTGNIVLQAQNNITVNAPLNLALQTTNDRFALQAGDNITINAPITTNASIFLEADSPHSTGGAVGYGTLTIAAPVTSSAGSIQLIGGHFNITAPVTNGIVGSQTGLTSSVASGTVTYSGSLSAGFGVGSYLLGQKVVAISSGTITLNGDANATLSSGSASWVSANPSIGQFTGLTSVTNSSTVTYSGTLPAGFSVGSNILGQKVVAIASGTITLNGTANTALAGGTASFVNVNPIWISTSNESDLNIGPTGKLTAAEIGLLNSSYQVLIGKAVTSGSDGLGDAAETLVTNNIEVQGTQLAVEAGSFVLQAQTNITVDSDSSIYLDQGQYQTGATSRLVLQAGNDLDLEGSVGTAGADIYLEADSPDVFVGGILGAGANNAGTLTINALINTSNGGYIQMLGNYFSINSPVNSGSRSTRISTSNGGPITIGTTGGSGVLSTEEIDMLISPYQVWVGRAWTAGVNGDGGTYSNGSQSGHGDVEMIADAFVISQSAVLLNKSPVLLFSSGTISLSAPLTTVAPLCFDGQLAFSGSGSINSLNGGLSIGGDAPTFAGISVGGTTTIANGINISASELQNIKTSSLTLYAGGTNSSILIDGITATNSANIGSLALQTGTGPKNTGDISFINNPSTFNSLTIAAAGDVNVDAALTVKSGGLAITADQFGTGTGNFTSTAPITLAANQSVVIKAAGLNIGGMFSSTTGTLGSLTFEPSKSNLNIQVGGDIEDSGASAANTEFISQSDLDNATSNGSTVFTSLFIGSPNGLNQIAFESDSPVTTFYSPLTIRGGTILGSIGTPSAPVNVPVTLLNTNTMTLEANIYTAGREITVQGPAQLGANILFNTTGSTGTAGSGTMILFNSTLNDTTGSNAITLVTGTGGNIKFAGVIGKIVPIGLLTGTADNITLPTTAILNNLSLFASGTLLDTGAITVNGTASLSGNNITLTTTTIRNYLDVSSTGAFLETGVLTVGGTTGIVGTAILDGSNITLSTTAIGSSLSVTVGNAFLEKGTLTVGGTASLVGNNLTLATTNIGNYLSVSSSGAFLDSGALTVGGTASLAGTAILGGSNITLSTTTIGNSLNISAGGALLEKGTVTVGGTATLAGNNLTFAKTFIGSNLSVTATASLVDSAALSVGSALLPGSTSITTLTPGYAINLAGANHLYGPISLSTAGTGNATLVNDNATILGPMSLNGNLTITTTGSVSQSGGLAIAGLATFKSSGYNINLAGSGNSFGSLGVTGSNVTASETGAIVLASSTISGALTLSSTGGISQNSGSVLNVSGTTTLQTDSTVSLLTAGNLLAGPVSFLGLTGSSTGNVTLFNGKNTILGSSAVGGNLALNVKGTITQSGSVSVSGTLSATSTGAITLTGSGNSFVTLGNIARGGALELMSSRGNLTLAGTIGGGGATDVTIFATGGNLIINGPSGGTAITGRYITLLASEAFENSSNSKLAVLATSDWWHIYTADIGGLVTGGLVGSEILVPNLPTTIPVTPPAGTSKNAFLYTQ